MKMTSYIKSYFLLIQEFAAGGKHNIKKTFDSKKDKYKKIVSFFYVLSEMGAGGKK